MTDVQAFEKIGRLQCQLEEVLATNRSLVTIIAQLLKNELDPSRLLVNMTTGQVSWSAEGTTPDLPSQINGVPECVVAQPKLTIKVPLYDAAPPVDGIQASYVPVTVAGQFEIIPGHEA